jgi:hypothetical protein
MFLWIMAGGFALGVVLLIITATRKKPKPVLIMVSIALALVCAVGFVVDIAVEPVKNADSTPQVEEQTEIEKFAENNDISVGLTESIETVLAGMELTDKSRIGVFHYELSDVYNWKQVEDWGEGQRYSAYMAQEHILYFYVKDDTVVGVRDGNGNVFYAEETQQ